MVQLNLLSTSKIFIWFLAIMIIVLFVGAFGFRQISKLSWIDSFHNASMYASGMGPLFEMKTTEAKLFSSIYTLMAGLVFISLVAALIQRIIDSELFNFSAEEDECFSDNPPTN